MPVVEGAKPVSPTPSFGGEPAGPVEERMPQQTAQPPRVEGPPPVAPPRPEPKPEPKPTAPPAPAPSTPSVTWHRPVEGVTPGPAAEKPAEKPETKSEPEPPADGDSTSRLLRAKRRAREQKPEE